MHNEKNNIQENNQERKNKQKKFSVDGLGEEKNWKRMHNILKRGFIRIV